MKFLSNILLLFVFAVSSLSLVPSTTDVTALRGGAAFQEEVGDPIPKPKKFSCVDDCANAGNCTTSDCAFVGNGICSEVVREFSGKCVAGDAGTMNSCTAQPANDYCYKDLRSRCTEENVTCTRQHSGCGSKMRCV